MHHRAEEFIYPLTLVMSNDWKRLIKVMGVNCAVVPVEVEETSPEALLVPFRSYKHQDLEMQRFPGEFRDILPQPEFFRRIKNSWTFTDFGHKSFVPQSLKGEEMRWLKHISVEGLGCGLVFSFLFSWWIWSFTRFEFADSWCGFPLEATPSGWICG